jgi:hypothetical protein
LGGAFLLSHCGGNFPNNNGIGDFWIAVILAASIGDRDPRFSGKGQGKSFPADGVKGVILAGEFGNA